MKIGFIGLGIMGSRMAANLLQAGHDLVVHNRTKAKADALLAGGATWAETPTAAARASDVLITILAHPQAVEDVAFGENGLLDALPVGALWIDCSTVHPAFTRRMAGEATARGLRFMDAPVAGSKHQAANAELLFFVGGDAADVALAQPLFGVMGHKTVHVGAAGMGVSMKVVVNHMLATAMAAFAEGAALGQALGISQEALFGVLIGGATAAPFLARKRPMFETGEYEVQFPLKWMHKDLHMVAEAAYETGVPMPVSNAAKELYQLAAHSGLGDEDFAALYRFLNG
jgi:3-hydroxyisobutyrate dehydrogenase-like beta-hydroxyacid dehydrogenase